MYDVRDKGVSSKINVFQDFRREKNSLNKRSFWPMQKIFSANFIEAAKDDPGHAIMQTLFCSISL